MTVICTSVRLSHWSMLYDTLYHRYSLSLHLRGSPWSFIYIYMKVEVEW